MMTVLDGRNAHKIPEIIQISENTIFEKLSETVLCLIIDNCFVPCVKNNKMYSDAYEYVLCAAYKTRAAFDRWYNRMCK